MVDAVSSQRTTDRAAGLHRAAQSGAFLVTSEMALFQLMQVGNSYADAIAMGDNGKKLGGHGLLP